MLEFILFVMGVAATLYGVLGGADFGAGVLDVFMRERGRSRIDVALAPVWEANHVWLVLVATVAFVAFPKVYAAVTTYLHLPILFILLGIVARGSAFTFRHYDPSPSKSLQTVYSIAFRLSSLLTPLFLGITLAATASGRITTDLSQGFYAVYIAPWNTLFGWATGLFTCALFTFEGSALLAAEYPKEDGPLPYIRITRWTHALAIGSGGLVLAAAYIDGVPWFYRAISSPVSIACVVLATALIPVVAYGFHHGRPWRTRIASVGQVALVLTGFFAAQYPVLVATTGQDITVASAVAPDATLRGLTLALIVGLAIILPGAGYLIKVYKAPSPVAKD